MALPFPSPTDNGVPSKAPSAAFLLSMNPATGQMLEPVPASSLDDVKRAVALARHIQPAWGNRPARERAEILTRLRDVVIEHTDEIAQTDRLETGKPLSEATGVIALIVDMCDYYGKLAVKLARGRKVSASPIFFGKTSRVYFRPAGVAAVISPWNYPFFLAFLQIIPALAAGNAVIHKPSEHSPRVGLLIGELCRKAGLPDDVLQVLVGDGKIGAAIIDEGVDVIAFTGAPETGKRIMAQAAKHLTPVILELGGKDAAIVCEDADLDRAVNGVTWGSFINNGQTCISIKRAIVSAPIYDRFVARVAEQVRTLNPSADEDANLGSLTMGREIGRLERQISESVAMGAKLLCGGKRLNQPGLFFPPTVLADCTPDMPAVREETFGPLLTILRAQDDEDALRLANDSEFGLAGSVWTRDRKKARRLVARFRTGGVAINDGLVQAMNVRLPFGGVKHSGVGRAGGELGYYNYCNVQAVMEARILPSREPTWFPYSPKMRSIIKAATTVLFHGSLRKKAEALLGRK